jgi:hypothetical protein
MPRRKVSGNPLAEQIFEQHAAAHHVQVAHGQIALPEMMGALKVEVAGCMIAHRQFQKPAHLAVA